MADNENEPVAEEAQTDENAGGDQAATATAEPTDDVIPEFEQLAPNPPKPAKELELSRFGGVHVTLTAELGRTELTIQELIGLAEGSVVELNRAISAPVELIAQGVPLGNGEVVVIDDQFAIRIKEIYPS